MRKAFVFVVLSVAMGVSLNAQDQKTFDEIEGTWNYTADQAPYEYQKGQMIFYKEEGDIKAKLDIQGNFIKTRDLKIEGCKIECSAYVEYEQVTIRLTLEEGKLKGTADSSEGLIPITLEKNKDKG